MRKKSFLILSIIIIFLAIFGVIMYRHLNTRDQNDVILFFKPDIATKLQNQVISTFENQGYKTKVVNNELISNYFVNNKNCDKSWLLDNDTKGTTTDLKSAVIIQSTDISLAYLCLGPKPYYPKIDTAEQIGQKIANLIFKQNHQPNIWTFNALGDVIIGRSVYYKIVQYKDFSHPFEAMASGTKNADFTSANLESSFSDHSDYPLTGMTFIAPTRAVEGLKLAGIDAVNLANNHSYSGGEAAYLETLSTLVKNNIGYFGGGQNFAVAHQPLIKTVKNIKIALLGYSAISGTVTAEANNPGVAHFSIAPWENFDETQVEQIETDIKAAKKQADLVFVYVHWGTEYTHQANNDQRTVAHRIIDTGADLVLGTHPHWVQGIEWYKNRLITYSLGNFVFDQEWSIQTKQGVYLNIIFDNRTLISAKLVPYQIEDYNQPRPVNDQVAKTILNDIYTNSWWP